jgi:hypothetical protein
MGAVAGLGAVCACVGTDPLQQRTRQPSRNGNWEIAPPKEGCYIGLYKEQNWERKVLGRGVSTTIDHYGNALGANPAIIAYWTFLSLGFPTQDAKALAQKGIVPYISIMPGRERWSQSFDTNDLVNGRCDSLIKKIAIDAVGFGEKHGGFFFTTMVEPNTDWWPWSRKPNTVQAMRRFWQIFEDQGANQYATWVWEAFCPARYGGLVEDPEKYYPGDRYVDWIGLNVFANLKNQHISESTTFEDLMAPTYEQLTGSHPQKPIMISEFGRTPGPNQPSWLVDAYQNMKEHFSPIKAAIYYDNVTGVLTGQDHTLDRISLGTLRDVFRDPYWIMAK